jgi:energy-coupling factor transport system substrate-specific component
MNLGPFIKSVTDFLANFLGGGLSFILMPIGLTLMVLAVCIIFLELSGRTISRKGIVPNRVRWDSTAIAIAAICGALYIAGGMLQVIPIVPGFASWTPIRALPPIVAPLFGLPGVIGISFAMPLSDAIAGKLTLGSVAGMLAHFIAIGWIPYKMIGDPSMKTKKSILQFYLWGVVVSGAMQATIIPSWLDFNNLLPPAAAWSAVVFAIFLNHMVGPAIVGPVILRVVFPRIKAMGLYWKDRLVKEPTQVGKEELQGVKSI